MPEKYMVKITTQAQEQLKEMISYINYTLQARGTAMKMLDTLEKEIASLAASHLEAENMSAGKGKALK